VLIYSRQACLLSFRLSFGLLSREVILGLRVSVGTIPSWGATNRLDPKIEREIPLAQKRLPELVLFAPKANKTECSEPEGSEEDLFDLV
jgi:hypothetical protein